MTPRTGLRAYIVPASPLWWISMALGGLLSYLMLEGLWGL